MPNTPSGYCQCFVDVFLLFLPYEMQNTNLRSKNIWIFQVFMILTWKGTYFPPTQSTMTVVSGQIWTQRQATKCTPTQQSHKARTSFSAGCYCHCFLTVGSGDHCTSFKKKIFCNSNFHVTLYLMKSHQLLHGFVPDEWVCFITLEMFFMIPSKTAQTRITVDEFA